MTFSLQDKTKPLSFPKNFEERKSGSIFQVTTFLLTSSRQSPVYAYTEAGEGGAGGGRVHIHLKFFPKCSLTRIVQTQQRPQDDYSPLLYPPLSVPKISFAKSLPTCRDHHPKVLDKEDKLRGMGAAILLTQRPPGC